MVSIVDIAPAASRIVSVLGKPVEIFAVTGRQWAALAQRYPLLKRQLAGLEIAPEDFVINGMETMPAIIAAGLGKLGDEAEEAAIDRLPKDTRLALMQAVSELSFPPTEAEAEATPAAEIAVSAAAA